MKHNIFQKRKSLRSSMISMLLLGWFLPLTIMILVMIFLVTGRINRQVENSMSTLAQKAADIFQMQVADCVIASKNASYMPVIREAYRKYENGEGKRELHESVTVFLEQQYKFNSNFKDAILIFPKLEDKLFYTFNNSNNATYNDIKAFQAHAREQIMQRSQELDTGVLLINIDGRIYLVRNLKNSKFETYAILVLEFEERFFMESLESIWGYESAEVYINGQKLMDSDENSDLSQLESLARKQLGKEGTLYYKENVHSYVCTNAKLDAGTATFVVRLENSVIYAQTWILKYIFILMLLFMIPLLFQVISFFRKKVTMPVQEMVMAAQDIELGNFGRKIVKLADSEEFYYMEESINHMSEQLKSQFERIYLEEIALRDAKIMALQSQINPHFLNNTLEIINWEARLNENYKVSGMIEALSTMLEATMNRKSESFISLSQELTYVDAYLYIISQRFGEKFSCTKEIDEQLLDKKVPRLIIQPIVENAVEHGMDISKCGKIVLRVLRQDEQYMKIEVEDNGVLKAEEKEKIQRLLSEEADPSRERRVSLGIRNVDQRLKIIYGKDCGLSIKSNNENHTISTLLFKIDNE